MTTFWTDKHILVTGGAGFLGSHLVPLLEAAGAQVFVPRSVEYDLRNQADVVRMYEEAGRIDILFHLAARVGGIGANQRYPADFYYDNTLMNTLICEYARRFEVGKLVAVGSVCAYPKICPYPFQEHHLFEGFPEETNAAYGISKRALLVHLQALRRQYDFNGIYLIPTNLYGPGDSFDPDTSHVIPALIRKIVKAAEFGLDEVEVWGTGRASRDFLYVEDCARALMLAAEHYDSPPSGPVNLGSGQEIYIAGLVKMLCDIAGYRGRIIYNTSKPDGQPRRVLNSERARHAFGWKATTRLEDGLRRTVEWWRERPY